MAEKRKFLGIKQVKKSTFDNLSDTGKTGYLWFVREQMPEEGKPDDCEIYLGTRKYGETAEDPVLTEDIIVSDGAPVSALGIWEDNTITIGTPIEDILQKLLSKELFPGKPTLPSISVIGKDYGALEIDSTVSISYPSPEYKNGLFSSSGYTSPAQKTPTGVNWSDKTSGRTIVSGFTTVAGDTGTVVLGSNIAMFTYSGKYTEPSNTPWTNLKHDTKSKTKIYTGITSELDLDDRATWVSGTSTNSVNITATGCYPCFSNISGSTLLNSASTKCDIGIYSASASSLVLYVPSEVANNKHFMFAYPSSGRTMTIQKYNAFTQQYEDYQRTPEIETKDNFYKGQQYKIWITTGDYDASSNFRMYFNPGLNSN